MSPCLWKARRARPSHRSTCGRAPGRRRCAAPEEKRTTPRKRRSLVRPRGPRVRGPRHVARAPSPDDAAAAPRSDAPPVQETIDGQGSEAEQPRAEEAQAGQAEGGGHPVRTGCAARATGAPDFRQEKVGRGRGDPPRLVARSRLGAAPTAAGGPTAHDVSFSFCRSCAVRSVRWSVEQTTAGGDHATWHSCVRG